MTQPAPPPRPFAGVQQHPRAAVSLTLGIVGLAGGLVLVLPLLLSPFAWYYGALAEREAAREPGRWRPGPARAGQVLGVIGSVLMAVLATALLAAGLVVLTLARAADPYAP